MRCARHLRRSHRSRAQSDPGAHGPEDSIPLVCANSSRRFDNNVWNVPLAQHGIEGRHILGDELLKILLVLVTLLFQLFLHRELLRGGWKIGAAAYLCGQVADLLQQHWRPSNVILAPSGRLKLQQFPFDADQFVRDLVGCFPNRFRSVVRAKLLFEAGKLSANGLDLINAIGHRVHLVPEGGKQSGLRLDVAFSPCRMRILEHVELLAELLFADRQRHVVSSRRCQQRNTPYSGSGPPAFRPNGDIRRIERTGSQLDFRAGFEPQVPPDAIDAWFCFARPSGRARLSTSARTTGAGGWPSAFRAGRPALQLADCFAARVGDRDSSPILLAEFGPEIEIDGSAIRWIVPRGRIVESSRRLRNRPE